MRPSWWAPGRAQTLHTLMGGETTSELQRFDQLNSDWQTCDVIVAPLMVKLVGRLCVDTTIRGKV